MENLSTTPTLDGDVEVPDNNTTDEQVETEVNQQVEETSTAETTNTDDYDKAWESLDTNNPSEELFGNTTDDTTTDEVAVDQSNDDVDNNQQVDTNGLMINNPILKYKGREIPIDSEEEAINLMQKGFKLESEMAKIKPYKSFIGILGNGNIKVEDLKAYDDAMSGNEQAKAYLAQKLGLQSTSESNGFFDEVDDEKQKADKYNPEVPAQDPVADYFASITEENPEVAGKISTVYSDLDEEFKQEIYNPQVFPMFASSIASGEFEKLYPFAIKERLSNPGLSWLQAYQMAGQKQGKDKQETTVPPRSTKVPKAGSTRRRISTDDYDRAFSMDTKDLEAKLFG